MIKQRIAFLLTLCLIIPQSTHAYTQAWLPHQPIKQKEANQTSTNKSSSNAIGAGISCPVQLSNAIFLSHSEVDFRIYSREMFSLFDLGCVIFALLLLTSSKFSIIG